MEISTSTNICAFQPGRERNPFDFCIAECAKGGYKVLDIQQDGPTIRYLIQR